MLNNYETVFIMTPVLSDEQAKETVSKYKQLLAANGAKLVHEVVDIIDGETTGCMLDGVGVDLTATAQAIAAALVIHEDHLGAGGFFP